MVPHLHQILTVLLPPIDLVCGCDYPHIHLLALVRAQYGTVAERVKRRKCLSRRGYHVMGPTRVPTLTTRRPTDNRNRLTPFLETAARVCAADVIVIVID
jgi:hypothetical protein